MATKRALRKTVAVALAECARLRSENARMSDQCIRYAQRVSSADDTAEALLVELGSARDELRRLRGLLGLVNAADRAMPEPTEGSAA